MDSGTWGNPRDIILRDKKWKNVHEIIKKIKEKKLKKLKKLEKAVGHKNIVMKQFMIYTLFILNRLSNN